MAETKNQPQEVLYENDNNTQPMDRRTFLKKAGATAVTTIVAADAVFDGPISKAARIGRALATGLRDKEQMNTLSEIDYRSDEVTYRNHETLGKAEHFQVMKINFAVEGEGNNFELITMFLSPEAQATLESIPSTYREDLIKNEPETDKVIGPVGFVTGDYRRILDFGDSPPNLDFMFPAKTSDEQILGPNQIVERFQGQGPEINRASGGITFENNKMHLKDRDGLIEAQNRGISFAQMPFYVDQKNIDVIMQQNWNYHDYEGPMGNTVYFWGGYFSFTSEGEERTGYAVCEEMVPLENMIKGLKSISDTNKFRFVMADASNGSAILTNIEGKTEYYGADSKESHLTPAAVVIR